MPLIIEGKKQIYLMELGKEHATQKYADWLNDPEVNQFLETRRSTIRELESYIEKKNESDDCLLLGMFTKTNDEHIGNIKLEPIDHARKEATVGILIGEKKYWGKGIGKEAIESLSNYAFSQLGLEKINLGVLENNIPAIKLYEKCGFAIVGIVKDAIEHDGVLHDKVNMSLTNKK
jgi:[ribosomal protein S5]-alanine N-acetyltransferase